MRVFWTVVLALALCLPLTADEIERVVRYDLDGDGVPETIGLRAYDGRYYESDIVLKQLVVFDQEGREIWSGPKGEWKDPLVFGGPYDSLDVHAVGIVDGEITLIGDHQRSDVRPTVFRLFRWDGQAFVPVGEGALIPDGERFVWVDSDESVMRDSWIDEVISISPDGQWRMRLTSIPERNSTVVDIHESAIDSPSKQKLN